MPRSQCLRADDHTRAARGDYAWGAALHLSRPCEAWLRHDGRGRKRMPMSFRVRGRALSVLTPHPLARLTPSSRPLPLGEVNGACGSCLLRTSPLPGGERSRSRRARERGRWASTCLWSRGISARGDKSEGSAGAEALRSCRDTGQPCGARAGCVPCRGCGHIVSGPSVRPGGICARASRVQDLELLRSVTQEAPLRDGRPCRMLPSLHSLDPRPRNLRRAKPRVRRPRRCRRLPQPGTAPAPRKPLS